MYKLGIILVMATAFACGGPQQPGTDRTQGAHTHSDDAHNGQACGADVRDGHLHDTEAIQSTLFSEQTEFFIEYEPLEAGKESAFLVHVTNLQSYRPYTAGSLTITAGGGQATSEAPARPGIFRLFRRKQGSKPSPIPCNRVSSKQVSPHMSLFLTTIMLREIQIACTSMTRRTRLVHINMKRMTRTNLTKRNRMVHINIRQTVHMNMMLKMPPIHIFMKKQEDHISTILNIPKLLTPKPHTPKRAKSYF